MEKKIIYKDLSFKLIGIAYKVYNSLGFGLQEKYYQRAYEKELQKLNIPYKKELKVDLNYNGDKIGEYFLKVAPRLRHIHIRQVLEYLDITKKKLALLIFFTDDGIHYRRVLNPKL